MASLALMATLVILFTIFIGPITYLLARLGFPKIIIYLLALLCFFTGGHLCLLAIPVWYLGLIPIYFGYISILRVSKKETQA
jgi:hypothetical protein